MNHIIISDQELYLGFLELRDFRTQHILNILKLKENDHFRIGIKNVGSGIATIRSLTSKGIFFSYESKKIAEKLLPITLILGGTRPSVLQRILRDITAFGAEHIIIFHTQNSEKSYLSSNLWKNKNYEKFVNEGLAIAQSVTTPLISCTFDLKKMLLSLKPKHRVLADQNYKKKLSDLVISKPLAIAIGPERGFTNIEIKLFEEYGFQVGSFGSQRILRTETACTVALSICAHKMNIM